MGTIYTIVIVIILLIAFIYITDYYNRMIHLATFRELLEPDDLVFLIDRTNNQYLAATILKIESQNQHHTLWRIRVYTEDGDYDMVTSDLNLFDKKY